MGIDGRDAVGQTVVTQWPSSLGVSTARGGSSLCPPLLLPHTFTEEILCGAGVNNFEIHAYELRLEPLQPYDLVRGDKFVIRWTDRPRPGENLDNLKAGNLTTDESGQSYRVTKIRVFTSTLFRRPGDYAWFDSTRDCQIACQLLWDNLEGLTQGTFLPTVGA